MDTSITFPRYESYKDSGIEWLGEVPTHWMLHKTKYLWKELEQRSVDGEEQLLSVSQYFGVVPKEDDSRSESLSNYKKCQKQDLIVNIMLAWMGGLGVTKHNGIVSPAYCVYRQSTDQNPYFLNYLYRTPLYLAEFARRSKGVVPSRWRMYTDDFGQVISLLPPRDEQDRIANFLDRKTAEIDEAIAKKQRLIELLKEQKAILINQAVTKGLNPNVVMRDSGVEWIGEIPEHWSVKRVKNVANIITSGPRGWAQYYTDTGPFFLQSGNLTNFVGIDLQDVNHVTPPRGAEGRRTRLINKDVLVCITGANTGRVAITDLLNEEVYINQHLCLIRPLDNIYPEYLAYCLHSAVGSIYFFLQQYGLKEGLGLEDVKSTPILIPPLDEQILVAQKVENILLEHEGSLKKINKHIQVLTEYRETLISNAVTGKIKI